MPARRQAPSSSSRRAARRSQLQRDARPPAAAPATSSTRDELYDRLHARLREPAAPPDRVRARRDRAGGRARRRGAPARRAVVSAPAGPGRRDAPLLRSAAPPVAAGRAVRGADRRGARRRTPSRSRRRADAARRRVSGRERSASTSAACATSGGCDEHMLRERLIARAGVDPPSATSSSPFADWIADPDGLFVADFDLLTRLPGLETLDIVSHRARARLGFPRAAPRLVAGARRDRRESPRADGRGRVARSRRAGAPPDELVVHACAIARKSWSRSRGG